MRRPSNRTARSFQELAIAAEDEFLAAQLVTADALAKAAAAPVALNGFRPKQNLPSFPFGATGGYAVEHNEAVAPIERARRPAESWDLLRVRGQDAAQICQLRNRSSEQTDTARHDGEGHRLLDDIGAVDLELQDEAVGAQHNVLAPGRIDENVLHTKEFRKEERVIIQTVRRFCGGSQDRLSSRRHPEVTGFEGRQRRINEKDRSAHASARGDGPCIRVISAPLSNRVISWMTSRCARASS